MGVNAAAGTPETPVGAAARPGEPPADPEALVPWILAACAERLEAEGSELLADPVAWGEWQRHAARVLAGCLPLLADPAAEGGSVEGKNAPAAAAVVGSKLVAERCNPVDLLRAVLTLVDIASDAVMVVLARDGGTARAPAVLRRLTSGALAAVDVAATWYDSILLSRAARIEAAERRRLARDLHDWVGSGISLAARNLDLYEAYRAAGRTDDAEAQIPRARAALQDLLQHTGAVVSELALEKPVVHVALGLKAFARQMQTPGVNVDILVRGDEAALPNHYREALFLVLREALRNALTHARARTVVAGMEIGAHDVWAAVDDDGVGLPQPDAAGSPVAPAGHGLAAMAERIQLLGGDLCIKSMPAQGVRVEVHVPLPPAHPTDPE